MSPFIKYLTFCVFLILQLHLIKCTDKPKVIIVGAGAAGISAGAKLLQNGINDVTILEAENRIGGRIYTTKIGDHVYELGSEILEIDENHPIFDLANATGLLVEGNWNATLSEYIDVNGTFIDRDLHYQVNNIIEDVLNDFEAIGKYKKSYGDYIEDSLKNNEEYQKLDPELRQRYFEWHEKEEKVYEGSNTLYDVNANVFAEYWEKSMEKKWLFKKPGFKAIFDVLMNKYPDPTKAYPLEEKIMLNKVVTNIDWSKNTKDNMVTVKCSDGTQYLADHVIVTVSLGVLKEQKDTLFTPQLPKPIQQTINVIDYGTSEVIYVKFPVKWWPEETKGFSFLWNGKSIDEVKALFGDKYENYKWVTEIYGFYPADFKKDVLATYLAGDVAKHVETLSDDEIRQVFWKVLKMFVDKQNCLRILGTCIKVPASEPETIIRTKWYSNPHFRGSYSRPTQKTIQAKKTPKDLATTLYHDVERPLVIFSGEATHDKYYSTVHGAILTGWAAADDVLVIYNL